MSMSKHLHDAAAWVREAAYEIDSSHFGLDLAGIPRQADDGTEYTLPARVSLLVDQVAASTRRQPKGMAQSPARTAE